MPNGDGATEHTVKAFFYGSFIRRDVQANSGFVPKRVEVGRLSGFDMHICPHAAPSRSDQHSIYGILVDITHRDLDRMYAAPGVGVFLPEAVLVDTPDGKKVSALCYFPPVKEDRPADREYLAKLIAAGREYGFPNWYLERLQNLP